MTPYERLTARFSRLATLSEVSEMLGWDAAAVMPPGGAAARGDQMAVLAGVSHAMLTAPDLAEDLQAAEPPADPWHATNLELMRQTHARATALPADLVEAQARRTRPANGCGAMPGRRRIFPPWRRILKRLSAWCGSGPRHSPRGLGLPPTMR